MRCFEGPQVRYYLLIPPCVVVLVPGYDYLISVLLR